MQEGKSMCFIGDKTSYLGTERVNQWPDRRDRAVQHRFPGPNKKVCRADRYVPHHEESGYRSKL